jgi:hypothetical protein
VRTVIWDFANEPLPPDLRADLERVRDELQGSFGKHLRELLDRFEIDAVRARIEHLLARGVLPEADPGYHSFPWPLV